MTQVSGKPQDTRSSFNIVGIGASAGGLEAFEQFFRQIPADTGMAFVLIPHLDPSHGSLLTEILQRSSVLPVHEALDEIKVEPNCVYVIPPNRAMLIFQGKLQLNAPSEPRGQRMPIDAFLRSLAEDRQEKAIGIILSGTGTDGTLGLRAIQGAGGLTLVQDPATAKYDGMPASAIKAGYANLVLPVDKMPAALMAEIQTTTSHGITCATSSPAPNGINNILLQLRSLTGCDFSLYKKSTINRRIERRMLQHGIEDTEAYVRYLKQNPAEVHLLFKELLINVTSFFRDAEAFAVLQNEILPGLLKDKPANYLFRVWVAGCATGEEAYSIAILLRELTDQSHRELKVQIYSTDLDDDAISVARAGVYPPNIAQDLTPERLQRFFVKEDAGYRIKKDIREMVVFAIQNIIKDPPFTKLDLLSCRNLMIYLKPELQDRLIRSFHYSLKPGGVLFLSSSESIGNHTELFSPINRKWKLFSAIHSLAATRAMMNQGFSWSSESEGKMLESAAIKPKETNLAELTRRVLVQFFAPVSVVIDTKGTILYIHGETGKYLRPAPGHASLNILEMAREGLELELRAAIHTAANESIPTLNRPLQVKSNGGFTAVNLSVRVLPGLNDGQSLLLVSFQETPGAPPSIPKRKRITKPAELSRIEELERDLTYLKESNQVIIEEQQVSNEELKSTNEELQSANEELQSSNEELETSKEELQSVNEELITVNSELQGKIEQLSDMQNDMKNLLENINIGIIFLDRHLKIRSFTRDAVRVFRLVSSDVGRPLNDIRTVGTGDDILAAAQTVLETLIPYERELDIGNGCWMLARIQPYRTMDNLIDGVVLTFTDITARIKAIATDEALKLADGIVKTIREPFVVLDSDFKVIAASTLFYNDFHLVPEEVIGQSFYELNSKLWDTLALRELLETLLITHDSFEEYKLEYNFPDHGECTMLLNARRITGGIGGKKMILLSIEISHE
ncbi:MAG: PAS domain-containing protein [Methylococcaceae bacterium]|nr:PAS domain-containing protein [Methylococcaceae bacterium]